MEPLPDFATLSDAELKDLIRSLVKEEQEVSYKRRLLHGKIDILRAELVARLQKSGGKSVLDKVDVDTLTDILTSKAPPPELAACVRSASDARVRTISMPLPSTMSSARLVIVIGSASLPLCPFEAISCTNRSSARSTGTSWAPSSIR